MSPTPRPPTPDSYAPIAPARPGAVSAGPATSTMRAVVQDGYGGADVLRYTEVGRPTAEDGEVLVRVHAAGVTRGVWHVMTGTPYAVRLALGLRRPRQPVVGLELAGTVVSVGTGVTRFAPGDEVFGTGTGAFAEYAVAREDRLARKPAGLTWAQAAIVPDSGATALQALTDVGRVRAGQRVLVTGASGGVGSFAVQIATALGARVTAECSRAKADLVRTLGAHEVLDHAVDDFADGSRRFDLIIDIAGNPSLSRLRAALTPTGTAVLAGGEGNGALTGMGRQLRASIVSPFVGQRLTMMIVKGRTGDLERLGALIDAGGLTPALERSYPLERAGDALRRLAAGDVRGKVAVVTST